MNLSEYIELNGESFFQVKIEKTQKCNKIENEIQHFIPQNCRLIVECVAAILLKGGFTKHQTLYDIP